MKQEVRESSLETYHGLGYRNLGEIQKQVINAIIELGGGWVSRRQIARAASLECSTVAGRVNELITAGRLVESEYRWRCPVTGRRVYKVKLPHKAAGLSAPS